MTQKELNEKYKNGFRSHLMESGPDLLEIFGVELNEREVERLKKLEEEDEDVYQYFEK